MAGVLQLRRGNTGIPLNDGEAYLNKGKNALQIGENGDVLTLVPINNVITGDIILDGNIYANNLQNGSVVLSAELSSSINVSTNIGSYISGAVIPAGTTLETILKNILTEYTSPTISGLIIKNSSTPVSSTIREVGESFTFNTIAFTATTDSSASYALSASFTASGTANDDFTYYLGNDVLSSTNNLSVGGTVTAERYEPGYVTFTLNAVRKNDLKNIPSSYVTFEYRYKNYMAASSTNIISNLTAQDVIDNDVVESVLSVDKNFNVVCNGLNDTLENYTYIMYPTSSGQITTIIQNGGLPVLDAFTDIGDYTITNGNSVQLGVKIYKSNSDKAFANGTTLAIS